MDVRRPAVAGAFYPSSKEAILSQLKDLFGHWKIDLKGIEKRKRVDCFGVVVPHAGWAYSGYVAARVFADIPKANTVIIMGPNHYGIGPNFSVSSDAAWDTPLGKVEVDTELARAIAARPPAELDETAHLKEHSIEVQLPFLQTVLKKFKIVPISIKHYVPDKRFLRICEDFGKSLAGTITESGKEALIVASTDLTHYEPRLTANKKDNEAMGQIEKLDGEGLFKVIQEQQMSMCGYAGVAVAMAACRALGAKKAQRVAYMTSGDTTGDVSAVVGYGGLSIV